ncbi:MAG: hypothetical protein HY879_24330 [Deltaproteobacteria bacterium]|nr:hypothetical protein [Deltaproteobacteria bacterium]
MNKPIKILHIDRDWQVIYILIREGTFIKSSVPLETALALLKKEDFDLILSEPQNIAILTPQNGDSAALTGEGEPATIGKA